MASTSTLSHHNDHDRIFDMTCASEATNPTEYSFKYDEKQIISIRESFHTNITPTYYSQEFSDSDPNSDSDSDSDSYGSSEIVAPDRFCQTPVALPSNSTNFDLYFPTRDRLLIRHDDATLDGNLNLRVDSQCVLPSGRRKPLTLFHLRMNDLRSRDFSIRRYYRESGREICHSNRQYVESISLPKPRLKKILSMVSKRRQLTSENTCFEGEKPSDSHNRYPTNVIKLEFTNYAQVEIYRSRNCHKFEYWGERYNWKRQMDNDGNKAFRLFRAGSEFPCAHIVRDVFTAGEVEEEQEKGGWVPPCSLWIVDDEVLEKPDVSDVIIATGLVTLVDDSIKDKWRQSNSSIRTFQLSIPPPTGSFFGFDLLGQLFNPKNRQIRLFSRK